MPENHESYFMTVLLEKVCFPLNSKITFTFNLAKEKESHGLD
jgi:hypothetical protein